MQSAVEGRFCDSAISVREAALELVGRHIASHPDVGFKVCGSPDLSFMVNEKTGPFFCKHNWYGEETFHDELLKHFYQLCFVVF